MPFRMRRRGPRPGLEWGVRESLTAYVANLPDGQVAALGAADIVPGTHPPRFLFPEVSRTEREVRFEGAAHIAGHRGMLRVSAFDPWLTLEDGRLALSITPASGSPRVTVAEVPMSDLAGVEQAPAVLTADGAAWLGPSYAAGDPASSITLPPTRPARTSTSNKKGRRNGAHETS